VLSALSALSVLSALAVLALLALLVVLLTGALVPAVPVGRPAGLAGILPAAPRGRAAVLRRSSGTRSSRSVLSAFSVPALRFDRARLMALRRTCAEAITNIAQR
jgi:hypothetical protein